MIRTIGFTLIAASALAAGAIAAGPERAGIRKVVLVELFTSQG